MMGKLVTVTNATCFGQRAGVRTTMSKSSGGGVAGGGVAGTGVGGGVGVGVGLTIAGTGVAGGGVAGTGVGAISTGGGSGGANLFQAI